MNFSSITVAFLLSGVQLVDASGESSTEFLKRIQREREVAKKETSEEHLDRIWREIVARKKARARERIVTVTEEPKVPRPDPLEKPPGSCASWAVPTFWSWQRRQFRS